MSFQISDIGKLVPELLLLVVALWVLLDDVFFRRQDDYKERVNSAALNALVGLGVAFVVTIIQGGFLLHRVLEVNNLNPAAGGLGGLVDGFLTNLLSGGKESTILGGAFQIDHLTHLGRLLFIGAAIITIILTMNVVPSNSPGEFYALIIFSTFGMILMTAAGELIMIYLGIEMTSIPLYVLAGYFRRNKTSAEAGIKYYIFGALSSAILLFGMSLVMGMTLIAPRNPLAGPTVPTSLVSVASAVGATFTQPNDPGQAVLLLGLIFMVAGMAYKVAVVPFHSWAPDVYQGAPTAITAFISTASKTAGFFLLYRVFLAGFGDARTAGTAAVVASDGAGLAFGGWASMIALIAAVTMLVGNLAAMPQTNAKRLLAYSSVAHAGFLLLGLVGISRDSGTALVYYLVVYTITNLGAFGTLALIEEKIGGTDLNDLNGLGKRSPGLALLLTVFVLSLAGIPPLSGFIAKFYVFIAAWQEGAKWLVIFAVINTIVSLFYYLRMLKAMYIAEPDPQNQATFSIPFAGRVAMTAMVLLVIGLGIVPGTIFGALEQVAVTIANR